MAKSKNILLFCIFILALVIGASGVLFFGPRESAPSVLLFRLGYELAPSKYSYLDAYSPRRRDVWAGYLPLEVDSFLCGRLQATRDEEEFNAIVHLYYLQAGGREGSCVYITPGNVREKIATYLVDHLNDEGIDLYRELVLLEEVRRGKSLGKGSIGPSALATRRPSGEDEWKKWMEEVALPLAKDRYFSWGRSNRVWSDKREINPLEGTEVGIYECCG